MIVELGPDIKIIRFVRPVPDMIAPGGSAFDWAAVRPTSADEQSAERRGHPVRVSVWDCERTTVEQARGFLDETKTYLRGELFVGEVLSFRSASEVDDEERKARSRLRVVYDPLDPPQDKRPGAEGHSGVEGLDRAREESKVKWKSRLRQFALQWRVIADR